MRPDQIDRLKDLSEKLADVVLEEADPDTWPGRGLAAADMTQQERGDRYWCKRNAAATFGLLERTTRTIADATQANPNAADRPNDRPELDQEVNRLEKEAGKLLEKVMGKAAAVARGKH